MLNLFTLNVSISINTEGIQMETERCGFIKWVKAYKKPLLLAGISVTAIIRAILGLKNKDAIMDLWESLEKSIMRIPEKLLKPLSAASVTPSALEEVISVQSYTYPQEAFDVSRHIRNLSGGRHHSAEKAVEAATLGISLLPNPNTADTRIVLVN